MFFRLSNKIVNIVSGLRNEMRFGKQKKVKILRSGFNCYCNLRQMPSKCYDVRNSLFSFKIGSRTRDLERFVEVAEDTDKPQYLWMGWGDLTLEFC